LKGTMDHDVRQQIEGMDLADPFDELPSLTCPVCGLDLVDDELFISYRVCGHCGRHFSVPARERVDLVVDAGTFREIPTASPLEGDLDNDQISALDRIAELHERPLLDDAIVTGTAAIGGTRVVTIALDDQLLGSHIGALGAEKIIVGVEYALARRLPVVAICAGGAARAHVGPLAMVQGARLAAVSAQVQVTGVPMVAVLTHPTSAEVFSSFASQCDLIFAEPGTQLGVTWSSTPSLAAAEQALSDEALLNNGWIDGVVARPGLRQHLVHLLDLLTKRGGVFPSASPASESLRPADEEDETRPIVQHPDRPRGLDYLTRIISPFIEIRGDRVEGDDREVICGIGSLNQTAIAIVGQDRSVPNASDSTTAIRKVQRMARLAGRFEMPLVLLVDSSEGTAFDTVRPDTSLATAKLSSMMAMLPVPVISVAVGTVKGVLGNVMMTGDRRLMLEHTTYHLSGSSAARGGRFPLPPSGSGTGHDWPARECERLGLVDVIVPEPQFGAHADPGWAAMTLKGALTRALAELANTGPRRLLETRHRRHRQLGQETEEGLAAMRVEMREWQEVQQSVVKSIEDIRERFGQRMVNQPRLSFQRPDLGELATRLRARREELRQDLLERAGRGDRSGE
jgi:acetyl-CoA carboxylase beta subunit/acetyl-CoA carboxylase alpha subunit